MRILFLLFLLFGNCKSFSEQVRVHKIVHEPQLELRKIYGSEAQFFSASGKKEDLIDFISIRNPNVYQPELEMGLQNISKDTLLFALEITSSKELEWENRELVFLINQKRYNQFTVFQEVLFMLDNGSMIYEFAQEKEPSPFRKSRFADRTSHLVKVKLLKSIFIIPIDPIPNGKFPIQILHPNGQTIDLHL